MWMPDKEAVLHPVALLAEGVDRNGFGLFFLVDAQVALLAEGVDRNIHFDYSQCYF